MDLLVPLAVALTLMRAPCAVQPAAHVSVRLHDYAHLDAADVAASEQDAAAIFRAAGVNLLWRHPARPDEILRGSSSWPVDLPADLTVILVLASKSRGPALSAEVAGFAAMSGTGGHLAFVYADRAEQIARNGNVPLARVLSEVIAHEVGHLLMPGGGHTRRGIMRPHWRPRDFRVPLERPFSSAEVENMRQRIAELPQGRLNGDN